MAFITGFVVVLAMVGNVVSVPTGGRRHSSMLDESGRYNVSWWFDSQEIEFEVKVQTTGWVGFGISATGAMTGADIVIGWVANGEGFLHDMYATANGQPSRDKQTNWWLSRASESGGVTTLQFYRKIRSCDQEHDMDIPEGTARVIFSWGSRDPSGDVTTASYHGANRGAKSFQLRNPLAARAPLPQDTWNLDVTVSNIPVPASKSTTYWCVGVKMPTMTQPNHMIRVSPIITPGNEAVVHHIILRYCLIKESEASLYDGLSNECYTRRSTDEKHNAMLEQCNAPFVAWAIGGGDFDFPPHVGMPVGPGYGPHVVFMEMHYDNPQHKQGIVDSSGVRLYLTPTLRQEHAALAQVGNIVFSTHAVPPGIPNLMTRGDCPEECLRKGLAKAPQGIKVFSAVMHSHLLGRKILSRVVRNGMEVDRLGSEMFYDFNLQEFRSFPKEVHVMPGDEIVTDCFYDSRGRNTVTYGGEGTENEMCMGFFYYYPRADLSICSTVPHMGPLFYFFGVDRFDFNTWPYRAISPPDKAGKTLRQLFNEHDWTSYATQREYQQLITSPEIPILLQCVDQEGNEQLPWWNETNRMRPFQEKAPEPRPSYCASATTTTEDPTGAAAPIGGELRHVMLVVFLAAWLFR